MGEFLKIHAVSIALHAGLVAFLGLLVPVARDVMARSRPVEIEFIAAQPEPRQPIVPDSPALSPSRLPALPRPDRDAPRGLSHRLDGGISCSRLDSMYIPIIGIRGEF